MHVTADQYVFIDNNLTRPIMTRHSKELATWPHDNIPPQRNMTGFYQIGVWAYLCSRSKIF